MAGPARGRECPGEHAASVGFLASTPGVGARGPGVARRALSVALPLCAEDVEEWKVVCGKFLAINAANMSCACPRSPRGLSPAAHLGDGASDLILIRKCSRFSFLRFLVRHTNQRDQVSAAAARACSVPGWLHGLPGPCSVPGALPGAGLAPGATGDLLGAGLALWTAVRSYWVQGWLRGLLGGPTGCRAGSVGRWAGPSRGPT